ncbi:MAG: Arc family DNA-binding protein [Bacteroidales bacterium]|nr:Arc family DNA-binding protein [Bacteroidales bacterium]
MTKDKENGNGTKTFLLRMDSNTMEAVERWAADEFRSVNGQLQWIVAEALKKSGRNCRADRKEEGGRS